MHRRLQARGMLLSSMGGCRIWAVVGQSAKVMAREVRRNFSHAHFFSLDRRTYYNLWLLTKNFTTIFNNLVTKWRSWGVQVGHCPYMPDPAAAYAQLRHFVTRLLIIIVDYYILVKSRSRIDWIKWEWPKSLHAPLLQLLLHFADHCSNPAASYASTRRSTRIQEVGQGVTKKEPSLDLAANRLLSFCTIVC